MQQNFFWCDWRWRHGLSNCRGMLQVIDLLDHQKNSKSQNQKVDGNGDEVALRQNRHTRLAHRL